MNIEINEGSINAYRTLMEDPKPHGLPFRPLAECFEPSDVATPKHILYKEYREDIKCDLPKVFFYIVMDAKYPLAKAPNGDIGYLLKFKPHG